MQYAIITTASVPQGPNGPLIPEIHANAPHAQYVARKGEINAWDNADFVQAVKATGRKTLIIAYYYQCLHGFSSHQRRRGRLQGICGN